MRSKDEGVTKPEMKKKAAMKNPWLSSYDTLERAEYELRYLGTFRPGVHLSAWYRKTSHVRKVLRLSK